MKSEISSKQAAREQRREKRMGGADDADIQSSDKYIHVYIYGVDLCMVERRQRQHIWGTQISELSYLLFIWGLKFHFMLNHFVITRYYRTRIDRRHGPEVFRT